MTKRLCRETPPGRPTVSGWSTRATAPGNADLWKQRLGDPDPVAPDHVRGQRIAAAVVTRWAIDRVPLGARWRWPVRRFPRAAATNASSPPSATSRLVTGRNAASSSSVRWSCLTRRPSMSWASMESRRAPSGPTCSVNSAPFMPPGILMAGAFPSGARSARTT